MELEVLQAVGSASTELAAFDDALRRVGLHDLNLITLSSVIPPGSVIVPSEYSTSEGDIGDRLYCVLAVETAPVGESCYAGLAWAQDDEGAGVFLEEHGRDGGDVEWALKTGLVDMCDSRAARRWRSEGCLVTGSDGTASPQAAIVIAAYHREGWPWPT